MAERISDPRVGRAMEVVERIRPLLAGLGPDVQGMVLGELVSLWLAGHPGPLRDELWLLWSQSTRDLATHNAKALDALRGPWPFPGRKPS